MNMPPPTRHNRCSPSEMNTLEVYHQAVALGLKLEPSGDRLLVFGQHCPPDFHDLLRQHKAELLVWLSRPPCPGWQAVPPSDLPLNSTQPSPDPADARRVMDYIVRQIGAVPDLLCDWCLARELAYWQKVHWLDEVCAYAAARDCACWQLNRTEPELWEFLEDINEAHDHA